MLVFFCLGILHYQNRLIAKETYTIKTRCFVNWLKQLFERHPELSLFDLKQESPQWYNILTFLNCVKRTLNTDHTQFSRFYTGIGILGKPILIKTGFANGNEQVITNDYIKGTFIY